VSNEQESVETIRVVKSARPWTGLILGVLFGLALAVVLQQSGIWPLDRLLLFGSAGLFGLIGILLGGAGRQKVGAFSSVVPLVLAVALIGFGATGIGDIDESGELNGGCTVEAVSDLDQTVVTDTSRSDPFDIDPDGSLAWTAASPAPITNHLWRIWLDFGGFHLTIADNDEPEPNTAEDLENSGEVDDVNAFIAEATDISAVDLAGILEVGGEIDGDGGACDGFGFVRLDADPLGSLIAQIAAGVGLLALIGLLVLTFNRTREAEVVPAADAELPYADAAAGGVAGAGAATATADPPPGGVLGAHERREEAVEPPQPPEPDDLDDPGSTRQD
jgi:hypothetical protein